MVPAPALPEVRRRLAAAVGFAARQLWRMPEIAEEDAVVLDLLVEALARMGQMYRPAAGKQAAAALVEAPPHIAGLVSRLEPLACRPAVSPAPVTPAVTSALGRQRTPSPVHRAARRGDGAEHSIGEGHSQLLKAECEKEHGGVVVNSPEEEFLEAVDEQRADVDFLEMLKGECGGVTDFEKELGEELDGWVPDLELLNLRALLITKVRGGDWLCEARAACVDEGWLEEGALEVLDG